MSSGTLVYSVISAVAHNTVLVRIPYILENDSTCSIKYNIYSTSSGTTTATVNGTDDRGSLLKFTDSVFVANPGKIVELIITY